MQNTTLDNTVLASTSTTDILNTTDLTVQANLLQETGNLKKKLKEEQEESQRKVKKIRSTLLGKIKEMLDFVEKVLGYKVKKSQNNYFLYSGFSEAADDGFHFCMTKTGDLPNFELQANDTYSSLPESLTDQLERQKCLPSFCASWQLDLYSQMTTLN